MAENKIFAGPRMRRIRNAQGLTQTAMAEALGISPSYLNLIERNQRPLTVQLILKLAEVFRIDPSELQAQEQIGSANALREVFADPLLVDELPGDQELLEIAAAAPNAAAGFVKLHRAYREALDRLSDLSELLARKGHEAWSVGARLPFDEVRDALETRPNYHAAIETAAEAFHESLSPGDDLVGALRAWLRSRHDIAVRVLPVDIMPNWRRRYDRHSRRLFLSERLTAADRLREIAIEAVLLEFGPVVAAEVDTFGFSSAEANRLARFELSRYAAHALMMPYAAFQAAAERTAYDVEALASRFQVSFEHVVNRLTTLQRQSAPGVPFFMLEVDIAGNRFRRAGARGFPTDRFGGDCPKLAVYAAFAQPGQTLVETVEMPNGARFLTIARTLEGLQAGFDQRVRRTAVLLGCDVDFRDRTIYGRHLGESAPATEIGRACQFCERQACLARAAPPMTRPLGLDDMVTGLSSFDFQR
ncbi:helix-turn-helix domain-containing protein [Consotaella aegiceratis]|uniref:helix-turn-helix domain-containing protein n=1 Tax=Consotaella aegiceratis TaxID=3097961 RepID=UPI002F400F75